MMCLMRFIGSRPLVGYYLEFDVAMIDRAIFRLLGMGLPQPKIEGREAGHLRTYADVAQTISAQLALPQMRHGAGMM